MKWVSDQFVIPFFLNREQIIKWIVTLYIEGVQATQNHYISRQICVKNTAPLCKLLVGPLILKKEGCDVREDSDTHASWHATAHTSTHSWRSRASHTRHSHSHHGIHLLRHHHELELFLLHVLGYRWVLVYLVLKQCSFELILSPLMVLVHPIVSYCADQHGHDHWILGHYFKVLLFE